MQPLTRNAPGPPLGIDDNLIAAVVDAFYGRIRADPTLGPIFATTVDDWPAHIEKLTRFWSSVLMMSGRYKGSPLQNILPCRNCLPPISACGSDCSTRPWQSFAHLNKRPFSGRGRSVSPRVSRSRLHSRRARCRSCAPSGRAGPQLRRRRRPNIAQSSNFARIVKDRPSALPACLVAQAEENTDASPPECL
jgi:hypothetical protein